MKQGIQTGMQEALLFTVDDHLRVQQQIEERANELWRAGGCCDQSALSDWLRAEREVLEQFVLDYDVRQQARREPSRRPTAEIKARRPKDPILRHPRPLNRRNTYQTMPL